MTHKGDEERTGCPRISGRKKEIRQFQNPTSTNPGIFPQPPWLLLCVIRYCSEFVGLSPQHREDLIMFYRIRFNLYKSCK